MRDVDLSAYSAQKPSRIKPEKMDLGELPPIEPVRSIPQAPSPEPDTTTVLPTSPQDPQSDRKNDRSSERTEIRPEYRSEKRSASLPLKRRTKRYSFEFYEDQIVKLKQLKIQAEMQGESMTLSDMARLAMDDYLHDKDV